VFTFIRSPQNLVKLFSVLALLSLPAYSVEGGQDGGGGNVAKTSSVEEVRQTIKDVHELYLNPPGGYRNPLYWLRSLLLEDPTLEEVRKIALTLTAPYQLYRNDDVIRIMRETKSLKGLRNTQDFLRLSPLRVEESGPCFAHGGKEEADASVSANRFGAEICFSVPRLQKISSTGLLGSIVALFGHEIAHLAGYGEREARLVQDALQKHSDAVLNRTGEITKTRLLIKAEEIFDDLKNYSEQMSLRKRRLDGDIGPFFFISGEMRSLIDLLPESNQDLSIQPKRPALSAPLKLKAKQVITLMSQLCREEDNQSIDDLSKNSARIRVEYENFRETLWQYLQGKSYDKEFIRIHKDGFESQNYYFEFRWK
jgi:hypothetical protein